MRNAGMKAPRRDDDSSARASRARRRRGSRTRAGAIAADRDNSPSLARSRRASRRHRTLRPCPNFPKSKSPACSFADRIRGRARDGGPRGQAAALAARLRAEALVGQTVGEVTPARQVPAGSRSMRGGLLLHLGMSGSLALRPQRRAEPGPHDHFDLVTARGTLRLTDPRRFGAVVWSAAPTPARRRQLLAGLGRRALRRPLRRRASARGAAAAPRRRQDGAAGRRHRRRRRQHLRVRGAVRGRHRPAHALRPHQPSARRAPRRGGARRRWRARVELGGSTLRDFRDAHGDAGEFQLEAQVYGRAGQPCRALRRRRSGASSRAQRSTFFCPSCQRR